MKVFAKFMDPTQKSDDFLLENNFIRHRYKHRAQSATNEHHIKGTIYVGARQCVRAHTLFTNAQGKVFVIANPTNERYQDKIVYV